MTNEELQKIHKSLRDKMKKEWNRVLPLGELISDRWEKAKYLNFGEDASIYDSSLVLGDVSVGEKTWIGPYTILDGSGGLTIGSFCSISTGVQIYTHDSVKWAVSGGNVPYDKAEVTIGDCCYIGPNVVIEKGVKIGDRCVIGANSLVNKDVPDNSIAFGTPCNLVGKVIIDANGSVEFQYDKEKTT